jgi:hypothetical protein
MEALEIQLLCAESHGQVQPDMLSVVLVLLFQEIYHYNGTFFFDRVHP